MPPQQQSAPQIDPETATWLQQFGITTPEEMIALMELTKHQARVIDLRNRAQLSNENEMKYRQWADASGIASEPGNQYVPGEMLRQFWMTRQPNSAPSLSTAQYPAVQLRQPETSGEVGSDYSPSDGDRYEMRNGRLFYSRDSNYFDDEKPAAKKAARKLSGK